MEAGSVRSMMKTMKVVVNHNARSKLQLLGEAHIQMKLKENY